MQNLMSYSSSATLISYKGDEISHLSCLVLQTWHGTDRRQMRRLKQKSHCNCVSLINLYVTQFVVRCNASHTEVSLLLMFVYEGRDCRNSQVTLSPLMSHKSSHLSDSHVHSCSRERHEMLAESKQLSCSRHKSSRERSRSRDARRDTYCRYTSHCRQFSSRSRSDSLCRNSRQNESRRCESLLAQTMLAELKLITHDASYFLLKSNNFDNLLLAKAESVWSTPPQNEARINTAFKVCKYERKYEHIYCLSLPHDALQCKAWSWDRMSSVCLSVTLVYHDHIGWKYWKLIARTISPTSLLFVAHRSSTHSQGNMEKFWWRKCSFNTYVHNVRLNWVRFNRESHDLRWRCGCWLFVYFCCRIVR